MKYFEIIFMGIFTGFGGYLVVGVMGKGPGWASLGVSYLAFILGVIRFTMVERKNL